MTASEWKDRIKELDCARSACLIECFGLLKDLGIAEADRDVWKQRAEKTERELAIERGALEAVYDKITDWFEVEDWTDSAKGITDVEAHCAAIDREMVGWTEMAERLARSEIHVEKAERELAECREKARHAEIQANEWAEGCRSTEAELAECRAERDDYAMFYDRANGFWIEDRIYAAAIARIEARRSNNPEGTSGPRRSDPIDHDLMEQNARLIAERDDLLAYYNLVKAWWQPTGEAMEIVERIEARREAGHE